MEIDSRPVEIDELQRAVDRLKMEELALAKETDEASVQRLGKLHKELGDRQEDLDSLVVRWQKEKPGSTGSASSRSSSTTPGRRPSAPSVTATSRRPPA